MRTQCLYLLSAVLPLAACTTITAPDEVKSLQASTDAFASGLRTAAATQRGALASVNRELTRSQVMAGSRLTISTACDAETLSAREAVNAVFRTSPYDSAAADAAYRRLQVVKPCHFEGIATDRVVPETLPAGPSDLGLAGSGSPTLEGSAALLNAYTDALADVATGETAAEVDAARSELATASKGLLAAFRFGGAAGSAVDLANQAISSIVAAKRNETTRKFLMEMDRVMPALMEAVGLSARLAHGLAALNHARAATTLGPWAAKELNRSELILTGPGADRRGSMARLALYEEVVSSLDAHAGAFEAVTAVDPMAAARGFAAAHHQLTLVYEDPKANRQALSRGLGEFRAAAEALRTALDATA